MTNEDIIKTLRQLEYPYPTCEEQKKVNEALSLAVRAVNFAKFTGKMLFDDWETDCKDLYPELACRRLVELGIVKLNDGVYSLKEGEEK